MTWRRKTNDQRSAWRTRQGTATSITTSDGKLWRRFKSRERKAKSRHTSQLLVVEAEKPPLTSTPDLVPPGGPQT